MVDEKGMDELSDLIAVKYGFQLMPPFYRKLSAKEIMETAEYKQFRGAYPRLCELVENG